MSDRSEAEETSPPAINRKTLMTVLISGAFVIILNQTLLNTALPAFMEDFGITASAAQWVTTSFMLVNGVMIPVTAFLIKKFTTRALFLTALGLFIVGTIICALAPVYPVLLVGRVVQAAAGGLIIPLMQTILFAVYPREERGAAMGTFGLVISFAPAIGPSLSGWIVDHLPWQTLFYMMLPIAGFSFAVVGAIALLWFILRQLTLDEPLLELRVLKHPVFALNTVLGVLVFIAMIGGMLVLPIYMQTMRDFSAMESGLVLLPGAIIMGIMSPITGRMFDAVGAKWLSVVGFALLSAFTLMLARLGTDTSFAYVATVNALRMVGAAMIMMPVTTAALNQLPMSLVPHGTALNNTIRQVAASMGTAILVTIMVSTARDPMVYGLEGPIHGANVAFFVSGIIAAVGFVGAFFITDSTGRPEMEEQVRVSE